MTHTGATAIPPAAIAALLAIQPIPELGFMLQFVGGGTVLGTFIAHRARRRNPARDPFAIQVRWAAVGLVFALLAMLRDVGT